MTGPVKSPLPTLKEVSFGDPLMEYDSPLLCVSQGGSVIQAVDTVVELTEGLTQLLMRQHAEVCYGENIYAQEVKALAFLSDAIWALACSAKLALLETSEADTAKGVSQ